MAKSSKQIDWIIGALADLSGRLDARGGASQLAYSSFDGGAGRGIDETDPITGYPAASFGTHFDGSHGAVAWTGPVPPMASRPEVPTDQTPGVLSVAWDGNFAAPDGTTDISVVATLDFTHVEVHASTTLTGFTAQTADTLIGTINTVRGGLVSVAAAAGTWYVKLVSRSGSGKRAEPSLPATVVVTASVKTADIQGVIDRVPRVGSADPTGAAPNGTLYFKRNTAGEIIGQWEYQTASPAGWKVRKVDAGQLANVTITETMIATGAVTAPKITASEELTAKVAQFLEVNAEMINVNELWADTAWLAAAKTMVLEVLSYTNGMGYTSTITGQGLKVTYNDGTTVWDVIRLGTFGQDYLGISDGQGHALASITGTGDVGTVNLYADAAVYSAGRRIDDDMETARGEVAYGINALNISTSSTTGVGLIETSFYAEPGHAYMVQAEYRLTTATSASQAALMAWYTNDGTVPQVGDFPVHRNIAAGPGTVTPSIPTAVPQTFPFIARFTPIGAAGKSPVRVRVLFGIRRYAGTGSINVSDLWFTIVDLGLAKRIVTGTNNGTAGTSNATNFIRTTETFALDDTTHSARGSLHKYDLVNGVWQNVYNSPYPPGSTPHPPIEVGSLAGGIAPRKTIFAMYGENGPLDQAMRSAAGGSLELESLRLNIIPQAFREGMGRLEFGFSIVGTTVFDPRSADPALQTLPPWNHSGWNREMTHRIGSWGQGVPRSVEFPRKQLPWLYSNNDMLLLHFGTTMQDGDLQLPASGALIDLSDVSVTVTYRKRL